MNGARPLTVAELWDLLKATEDDHRLHALVCLQAYQGARISEALALRWCDVRSLRTGWLSEVELRKASVKGKRAGRRIGMTEVTRRALERLASVDPVLAYGDRFVFQGRGAGHWSRSAAHRALERLFDDVLDDRQAVSSHSLRKFFASYLDSQGVRLHVISRLLGHEDLRTTKAYLAPPPPRVLRDAVAVLPAPPIPAPEAECPPQK